MRRDRFNRYVSALVYLPKEKFNSTLRARVGDLLISLYGGRHQPAATHHAIPRRRSTLIKRALQHRRPIEVGARAESKRFVQRGRQPLAAQTEPQVTQRQRIIGQA